MKLLELNKSLIKFIAAILLFFFSSLPGEILRIILDINAKTADPIILYSLKLFSNLVLALCLFFMFKKDLIEDFKKFKKNFWSIADTAIKYWTIGLIVMMVSNILITTFSPVKIANNEEGVRNIIEMVPFIAFILTTVLAPFTEELIFRKSFRGIIHNKLVYVLVSGLVFGACHIIFSATSLYDYLYLVPYSALGIAFSYIYCKTDNIYASIFVHMIHNGVITLFQIFGAGMILL